MGFHLDWWLGGRVMDQNVFWSLPANPTYILQAPTSTTQKQQHFVEHCNHALMPWCYHITPSYSATWMPFYHIIYGDFDSCIACTRVYTTHTPTIGTVMLYLGWVIAFISWGGSGPQHKKETAMCGRIEGKIAAQRFAKKWLFHFLLALSGLGRA